MAFSLSRLWQRPDCSSASLSFRASPCPPHYLHLLPTAYLQQASHHPPRTSVHRPPPVPSTSQPHLLSTSIDINAPHFAVSTQFGSSTLPISFNHCHCSLCLSPGTSTPVSHHRRGDAKFLFCAVQVPARLCSQC